MNEKVKVSVIIPVYNVEKYLDRCVQSVLNQTLKEIEIILIDDGSTDSSLTICNKYAEKDSRVQVYSNKNIGQGLERNFGIKKAIGKYIAFLDSDDQYKEDALKKLYQKAIENDADIVSGGYADVYSEKIIKEHFLKNEILDNEKKIKMAMLDMISYEKKDGYFGCIAVWDSIFKRELIVDKNIEFLSEREIYSEDLFFKLTAMFYSKKIILCSDIIYLYQVNENSFTNKINIAVLDRIVNLYENINVKFDNILNEYGLEKRNINRVFFTLRFNIKKVSKSKEAKIFYKMIMNNQKLMNIIRAYHPTNFKNYIIYYLIKWKMLKILQLLFKFIGVR